MALPHGHRQCDTLQLFNGTQESIQTLQPFAAHRADTLPMNEKRLVPLGFHRFDCRPGLGQRLRANAFEHVGMHPLRHPRSESFVETTVDELAGIAQFTKQFDGRLRVDLKFGEQAIGSERSMRLGVAIHASPQIVLVEFVPEGLRSQLAGH